MSICGLRDWCLLRSIAHHTQKASNYFSKIFGLFDLHFPLHHITQQSIRIPHYFAFHFIPFLLNSSHLPTHNPHQPP